MICKKREIEREKEKGIFGYWDANHNIEAELKIMANRLLDVADKEGLLKAHAQNILGEKMLMKILMYKGTI